MKRVRTAASALAALGMLACALSAKAQSEVYLENGRRMEGVIIVARPGARCLVRRGEETLATVSLAAASSSAADHVFSDQIAIDITTDHRAITVACTWPSGETLAKSFEYRPNTIIADGPLGCVSLPPHPTAAERKEHKACLARPRSFSYAYDAYPQFMRVYD